MKHHAIPLCLLILTLLLLAGCGGGGGSAQTESLSIRESQRYFPLTDGNVWVTRVTDSVNNTVTSSYTSLSRAGTGLVGNAMAVVMTTTSLPSGTMRKSYLGMDQSGIMVYGNDDPTDTITAALVPYRVVSFPIQVGTSFRQVNKTNIDYGRDLNGDGINEKIDITADVVVRGFESVTTAAGTFPNCLRIDTQVTEILTLSSNGGRITASGVETVWHAQDIGPVKQVTTISGNGSSSQTNEELTGYMVDGRSRGLSLQVAPATSTIDGGATVQLSVTLLDASNAALMAIPAQWVSDNTTIADVDASGVATGNKAGTATLTPWVGGVAGQPVTLNVVYGLGPGVRYSVPAAISNFWCGDTAIGDLNGDGRNDIAVKEEYGSRILLYYQNAAGGFDPPQVISTSLASRGIAIGDINNDGLADLVVSGNLPTAPSGWLGRVVAFRQNPATHALNAGQEYVLSTNAAGTLAIADLNSDGLPDIVVTGAGNGGNGVLSFLYQRTDGTLGAEYVYTSVPVTMGGEIHVADMNSDGRNDIVVQSDSTQLAVIKQLTPGVYSTSPDYFTIQTSYWPFFKSFALGDLNGDGRMDIAVADPGNSGYLNLFFQDTTGTLSGPTLINFTGNTQDELKIADMDGDGLNDLLILTGGYQVMFLPQSATHTFQNYRSFFMPTQSFGGTSVHQAMSIGDVTGDGLPDVVASWSDEGIYLLRDH